MIGGYCSRFSLFSFMCFRFNWIYERDFSDYSLRGKLTVMRATVADPKKFYVKNYFCLTQITGYGVKSSSSQTPSQSSLLGAG